MVIEFFYFIPLLFNLLGFLLNIGKKMPSDTALATNKSHFKLVAFCQEK